MKKLYILSLFITSLAFGQVTQVIDLNDGIGNSSPANLFIFGSNIYFSGDDSSGVNSPGGVDVGRELWRTDGTSTGTELVEDLRPGTLSSSPGNFFTLNGVLYFSANNGAVNTLFQSDGTTAGTTTTGLTFVFNPVELDNLIYFVDTLNASALTVFDGTSSTQAVNAGTGTESIIGGQIVVFDNKIFAYMDYSPDEPTIGRELYSYNPTTDTYTLIKDIDTGIGDSSISNFTILGTELYFEADFALWKTDGTNAGTIPVASASSLGGVNNIFAFDGKIFFEGDNSIDGDQLYVHDPVAGTTTNISMIAGANIDHDPSDYAEYNGYLYYRGEDANDTDGHLFRTNGSTIEQLDSAIKDIDEIIVFNNVLYFEGDDNTTGNELFTFNPATLNVTAVDLVSNDVVIYPNPSNRSLNVKHNFNSKVSYSISDINGRTVLNGTLENNQINHNLSAGMYLLNITNLDNIVTKKVIVK